MAPHRPLIDTLFAEMRGRIKEDDSSVPVRDGDWLYWWAFKPGAQYRTWYRRPAGGGDDRDRSSTRRPRPRASNISGSARWRSAPTAARRDSGRRQRLGALQAPHPRSRHRPRPRDGDRGRHRRAGLDRGQPRHRLHRGQRALAHLPRPLAPARPRRPTRTARSTRRRRISPSRSASAARQDRSLIFISTGENSSNEVRFVPADNPEAPPTLIAPRRPNRPIFGRRQPRQIVDPHQRRSRQFPPRRGRSRPSRRLARRSSPAPTGSICAASPPSRPSRDHRAGRRPRSADPAHLRRRGAPHPVRRGELHRPASAAIPNMRRPPTGSPISSMVTPPTIYDYHPADGPARSRSRCRRSPRATIPRNMSPSGSWSPARDGRQIPVSIVYPPRLRRRTAAASSSSTPMAPMASRPRRLHHQPHQPARPRLCLCHRPYPRRRRPGLWLVPRRQARSNRTNTFNDFVDVARGLIAARLTPAPAGIASRAARPAAS